MSNLPKEYIMVMDKENLVGRYHISFPEVANQRRFSAHTRHLARKLMKESYMLPGDYFRFLYKDQYEYIKEICDEENTGKTEYVQKLDELLVIVLMLMHGEGIIAQTEDEIYQALTLFKMFIAGMGLEKAGLVEINYHNITFGEDCLNRVVFVKKDLL